MFLAHRTVLRTTFLRVLPYPMHPVLALRIALRDELVVFHPVIQPPLLFYLILHVYCTPYTLTTFPFFLSPSTFIRTLFTAHCHRLLFIIFIVLVNVAASLDSSHFPYIRPGSPSLTLGSRTLDHLWVAMSLHITTGFTDTSSALFGGSLTSPSSARGVTANATPPPHHPLARWRALLPCFGLRSSGPYFILRRSLRGGFCVSLS